MVFHLQQTACRMENHPGSKWKIARGPDHLLQRAASAARAQALLFCCEPDIANEAPSLIQVLSIKLLDEGHCSANQSYTTTH